MIVDFRKTPRNRLEVCEAAFLLGCSEEVIRRGLRQGTLKFGMAVKASKKWSYIISKPKFEEITGIKVE